MKEEFLKREAEKEEQRKQEEAAKLTPEVRKAIADRAEAEKQKNLGNDFYKKKKFQEAI
jgi:hypothetical protein